MLSQHHGAVVISAQAISPPNSFGIGPPEGRYRQSSELGNSSWTGDDTKMFWLNLGLSLCFPRMPLRSTRTRMRAPCSSRVAMVGETVPPGLIWEDTSGCFWGCGSWWTEQEEIDSEDEWSVELNGVFELGRAVSRWLDRRRILIWTNGQWVHLVRAERIWARWRWMASGAMDRLQRDPKAWEICRELAAQHRAHRGPRLRRRPALVVQYQ